jgi:general secretion pathway protein L
MSVLVILQPPAARAPDGAPAPADYAWVLSADGRTVARQGRAATAQLPRADSACLVLADVDVSWQRIAVPKAPSARLRAALGAVLEEQLLDDDEALHLALEAGAAGGQPGWVAAVRKDWLAAVMADLERAGVPLDRVAPLSWPDAAASLHALPGGADGEAPTLVWCHGDGVACLRLAGTLARQRLAAVDRSTVVCSAHPAAAAEAERWLEGPVAVLGDADRALQALRSPWNLRQFDLAPRHRGLQAVREGWRRLAGPAWRPLRWGLVGLLLVQLVGLNAWAWRLEQDLRDKRQAQVRLLQTAHPQVRSVLDAPLQMQRETELLRAAAGRPGPADLEPLLDVAAAAWPEGQPPLQALRFEPGRLAITTTGWDDTQRAAFAERVRAAGYASEVQGVQLVIRAGGRS